MYRVFYDRLVVDEDRDWLFTNIKDITKMRFGLEFDALFAELDIGNTGAITDQNMRSLVYCDFEDPKADIKAYRRVEDANLLSVQKVRSENEKGVPFFGCCGTPKVLSVSVFWNH